MKKYFLLLSISLLSYANLHSQTAIDSALNNMNVDSIHDSTKLWKLYKAAKEDIAKYESEKEFEIKQQLDSLKHLDEIRIQQAENRVKDEEIKSQKKIQLVLFRNYNCSIFLGIHLQTT